MYGIKPELNKQIVLSYINEKDIFRRYLGEVDFNNRIPNPFRLDKRPTCEFFVGNNGSLLFIDRAGFLFGDCFKIAQTYYINKGEDLTYQQTLERVVEDFKVEFDGRLVDTPKLIKEHKLLRVKRQDFTEVDLEYWSRFCITPEILNKFKVSSCHTAWINDKIVYSYNPKDPGYIYHFGGYNYKIYFPFRKEFRFLSNTSEIQGFSQLPSKSEFLIITKSLKDIMVYDLFNIPAIAPQAETNILSREIISQLSLRFNQIYTNFDFDRTGLKASFRMFREQGIPMLLLTNGKFSTIDYGAKDIAEYINKFGKEKTLELIKNTYNKII